MDFKNETFDMEFTDECIEELNEIYEYISNNLKEDNVAKRLLTDVTNRILNLASMPEMYIKIGKVNKLNREYYRITIKNYVILYNINFKKKKAYISHMIYGKRNYLK